ncbi:MAG: hypothetical protein LBP26_05265 [Clostridiales bacterium]|jgi:hypothetical protein|nr:hypothetical protein [Clostridiales bacterium]
MSGKTKKIIRIAVTAAVVAIDIYLLYALIGTMAVWLSQPRFILPDGGVTSSLGFLIIFIIYAALAAAVVAAQIAAWVLYGRYKRRG